MRSGIREFRVNCFEFPRDRVIGDSQVSTNMNWVGTLELSDENGLTGLGFFFSLFSPMVAKKNIEEVFRREYMADIKGQTPEGLVHRLVRPRGGRIKPALYFLDQAVNQALWDLASKRAGLPLYEYLGGTDPKVPAYCSGLCFHLSETELHDFYSSATQHNFSGYKIKVGHPDVEWDLRRLAIVTDAVGSDALIMVDSNEAWTPKETIRRIRTYQDAGFKIFWVEDPILRHDLNGLKEIRRALPDTHLNAGEYLDLAGKTRLAEESAADIINIHGDITAALRIGWLCSEHGIPISVGNTQMEVGAHLASALPEVIYTEHSLFNAHNILHNELPIENGCIVLPNTPGHGLEVSDTAITDFKPRQVA